MTNPQYEKGVRLERKTQIDLSEKGWLVVRAAGSKGETKADLVAFHPDGRMLLVQCKSDGKISPGEWNTIFKVAGWCRATAILASNGPRGRGVTYERLDAPKVPRSHDRPCSVYDVQSIVTTEIGEEPCRESLSSGS